MVNIVDGTVLERNLIFTLQLLELERPVVAVVNMVNLLKGKEIEIDFQRLEEILQIIVIPVEAIYGKGIAEILDAVIGLVKTKKPPKPLKFGKEVEARIEKLIQVLKDVNFPYSKRWLAIKLLEKDKEVEKLVKERSPEILDEAKKLQKELEEIHKHDSSFVIAAERCFLASKIANEVIKITAPKKIGLTERLDRLTSHKVWGYFVMFLILGAMFLTIFKFGNWLSSLLENTLSGWQGSWEGIFGSSTLPSLIWAAIESIVALIEIALPYIVPFYFILFLLEDWGYLARIAFLLDSLMHKLGVHGKACIPLMLGFGCNVPACLSCRIMETQRERFITGFLVTFIPCSAITVIIMGLVGKFLGISWVLVLYFFVLLIIFLLGKAVSKVLPGEPVELIMSMPDYKFPHFKTVILQTWFRLKEFLFIAAPLVLISGVIIKGFCLAKWLGPIANFLSPITVQWLGLPAITGILLIFGILRKELILVMLSVLLGTANFAQILSPVQMLTLALVSIFYIPCIATISALWKEFGWKRALGITAFKIIFAILIAGIFSKIYVSIFS